MKPFPLDGGRVGMGVTRRVSRSRPIQPSHAAERFAFTPIPGPSPIKGEGRGAMR